MSLVEPSGILSLNASQGTWGPAAKQDNWRQRNKPIPLHLHNYVSLYLESTINKS